jgi:hypothetical protein
MTFTQNILIAADTVITRAHNNAILWVDLKLPEGVDGWRLKFAAAADLVDGGPFLCRVKKYHVGGTQPIIESNVGEKVDRVHDRIYLRQTQEYCDVSAFVHPVDGPSLFTFGAAINLPNIGHRTVTQQFYQMNPQDFDVLHRCVPPGQAQNVVVPRIRDFVGVNPGTTSPAYNSKVFLAMKCDTSTHGIWLGSPPGEPFHTAQGAVHNIVLSQPGEMAVMRGMGDGWWCSKMSGF